MLQKIQLRVRCRTLHDCCHPQPPLPFSFFFFFSTFSAFLVDFFDFSVLLFLVFVIFPFAFLQEWPLVFSGLANVCLLGNQACCIFNAIKARLRSLMSLQQQMEKNPQQAKTRRKQFHSREARAMAIEREQGNRRPSFGGWADEDNLDWVQTQRCALVQQS